MKLKTMKKAAIEQIILWMVLLTIFVTFLFFIIDYSLSMRVKDNADSLSEYGARMVSLGKTNDEIASGLNNIKLGSIANIAAGDIVCVDDVTVNHQVQFNVIATYASKFLANSANNVQSKAVVFNETANTQRTCTLNLTFQ